MWYCSMHVVFEQRHEAAGQTLMLFVKAAIILGEGYSFGGKSWNDRLGMIVTDKESYWDIQGFADIDDDIRTGHVLAVFPVAY